MKRKNISTVLFGCLVIALSACHQPFHVDTNVNGKLIIFHAGSLSVPFKEIADSFMVIHPNIELMLEPAGSVQCARKITELKQPCDIIAVSDYLVIDKMLIPEYTSWNIRFATNEMVIAYNEKSKFSDSICHRNWYAILQKNEVAYGRADPNSDPCGYRTVMTLNLAAIFYDKPDLAGNMLKKDTRFIRPKEVDLLALLETHTIDYIFIYRSVAVQHGLRYINLPDEINLKDPGRADHYRQVSVEITGKKPGEIEIIQGEPMLYGVTLLRNAPNKDAAMLFLEYLLTSEKGGAIMERNGQPSVIPTQATGWDSIPAGLKRYAVN
ncbi:MAG: tungstate ABC transporter substrate-binding protein WtpA [Bacteroidetes bacterium]|nr:tungstate ABC transporter substrate-binding protein WtpA [Bacteroidota bacterium]